MHFVVKWQEYPFDRKFSLDARRDLSYQPFMLFCTLLKENAAGAR